MYIDMRLCPKRKIVLLILAFCIAFTVIVTETLTAASLDHDCIETDCSPCFQIEAAALFLKTIKLAGIFLFLAVYLVLFLQTPKSNIFACFNCPSPVMLKVRFNC
ncbi:MAG: hypothetical protein FWG99_03160 [Treponema sp.]|nr:hypothetical protein [Treponema sp.]